MSANKHATPTEWVDPGDAPELTDAFFEQADEYVGEKLVRRGRPKAAGTKEPLKLRLDADVLAGFAIWTCGQASSTRFRSVSVHARSSFFQPCSSVARASSAS